MSAQSTSTRRWTIANHLTKTKHYLSGPLLDLKCRQDSSCEMPAQPAFTRGEDLLVGLVVKASTSRAEDPEFFAIAIGTKPKISQVTPNLTPVSISGYNIPFSQSVRNLGVFIDETLSMDVHIKHLCRILFCQLRRLGKIRPFLSTDAANKLAVSFVLTRLDYCNSLLAGLPDNKLNKLQRIQNHAARIVLRKPRHVSATSLLRTLHWLPVKARIQYKIACLCFQCLSHNTMPPYLSDLLHSYQPPRTLRSLDTSLLSVPRFCLETFGRRSFSVFGPTVWNSLPLPLRKTQCFSTFKKKLKTHLFEKHLS